ncbi:hypothetical protein NITUZ_30130 [Candidatus Nitrosotenuis uzonensis]|uniref:Uncharacterized protein n=1 Tax=Candidatus Nitrosotenuis uzonensis TaxID=1407055 RepID=V6ASL6_9ARCH|nr:hypothetical protein NITUZ_30130 [Candidatus Nitrosotenuis uzonensis]
MERRYVLGVLKMEKNLENGLPMIKMVSHTNYSNKRMKN